MNKPKDYYATKHRSGPLAYIVGNNSSHVLNVFIKLDKMKLVYCLKMLKNNVKIVQSMFTALFY